MAEIKYEKENEPIIISKSLMDMLLKQNKFADLYALYCFYYYTAKWQETNSIRATTSYTAKGLKWPESRVKKTKKQLIELGLITDIVRKDEKTKKIKGHYIYVKFIWSKEAVQNLEKTTRRKVHRVENLTSNALSVNSLNPLSSSKISSKEEIAFANAKAKPPFSNPSLSRKLKRILPLEKNNLNTKVVKKIVNHWNSLGYPFVKHNEGTKRQKKIDSIINKILKKPKITLSIIIETINTCYALFTEKSTIINPKVPGYSKIGLDTFFKFSIYDKKTIEKYNSSLIGVNSWFEECQNSWEYLIDKYSKVVKDKYPAIAEMFQELWIENCYLGKNRKFTLQQENHFKIAAEKLFDFIEENYDRLDMSQREKKYPQKLVQAVYDSLENKLTYMHTGYLIQDFLYSASFPNYLEKAGFLRTDK